MNHLHDESPSLIRYHVLELGVYKCIVCHIMLVFRSTAQSKREYLPTYITL